MATLSVLAAALEATRKNRYAPASKDSQQIDLSDLERYPTVTDAELLSMSGSITPALYSISCYEVMGASTQVVVVEETAPLTIPFIAAQETQVSTCFVWCSEQRRYTGVLSVTEYLKVLLYCDANPSEVERMSNLTVREWLALKRAQQQQQLTSSAPPESLISATADESLAFCIERMLENKVRRLAVVADDADDPRFETSILAVITYDILIQHLAHRLFSTDVFSNNNSRSTRRREGGIVKSIAGSANATAAGRGGGGEETTHLSVAADVPNDSMGSLPYSVQKIVGGGEFGGDSEFGQDDGEDNGEALLTAISSTTGAYRTIFDIPYARLPRLGRAAQHKAIHGSYPPPIVVGSGTPISVALRALIDLSMHSIAVIDDLSGADMPRARSYSDGALSESESAALAGCLDGSGRPIIDVITRNDVIRMESGGVFNLRVSVRDALSNIYSTGYNTVVGSDAMRGPFSPMDTIGGPSASRPLIPVFYETDTLRDIIEHFATRRVPVLFLVDPKTDAIVSQLSITEVFSFLSETAGSPS